MYIYFSYMEESYSWAVNVQIRDNFLEKEFLCYSLKRNDLAMIMTTIL